jgi:integral membrane protein
MKLAPKKLFQMFATAEVFTWAFLLSALFIRATIGIAPEVIFAVGATHGFVFLGYGVTAALVGVNQRWKLGRVLVGIALAIVPFATLPFDKSLAKKGLLEGGWRTTKSEAQNDNTWFDGLFRWFIARPVLLIAVLLVGVVAMFSFLLFVGPPDQWGR